MGAIAQQAQGRQMIRGLRQPESLTSDARMD